MGIFNKLFNSEGENQDSENAVNWIKIETIEMLDDIAEESHNQPVAILKHSTSCGISRMVLRKFEKTYDIEEKNMKLYFLDILNHRDISNKIASRFNVPHESPQLIVLKNGKVVYDASHSEIEAESLNQFS